MAGSRHAPAWSDRRLSAPESFWDHDHDDELLVVLLPAAAATERDVDQPHDAHVHQRDDVPCPGSRHVIQLPRRT